MVVFCPDISYANIELRQYSSKAAGVHDIYRYLKATRIDGIYYWRKMPCLALPIGHELALKHNINMTKI